VPDPGCALTAPNPSFPLKSRILHERPFAEGALSDLDEP